MKQVTEKIKGCFIIGVILIIVGIFFLAMGDKMAESRSDDDGWKNWTTEKIEEEKDKYSMIGWVTLILGIGIEVFAITKLVNGNKSCSDEKESLDRTEARLKELNNSLKDNDISKKDFENRKESILNDLNITINMIEILKKRISEMEIDNIISKADKEKIFEKINVVMEEDKKRKKKIKIIIALIVIIILLFSTISNLFSDIDVSNSSSGKYQMLEHMNELED